MQKKNLFYFIGAILILTSCGNNPKSSPDSPITDKKTDTISPPRDLALCTDCDYGNFEITEVRAKRMIDSFNSIYRKDAYDKKTIGRNFWIDACYIKSMLDYINTHPSANIDAVKFYFGTDKNRNDKVQLFITPVSQRRSLWPADMFPAQSCTPLFGNYENDPDRIAKPMISYFNKKHRHKPLLSGPKRDSLSVSVLFKKCVLECIVNTIKNNQDLRLNGINVYNAAYHEMNTNIPSQKYPNQSTIVIVFTKLNNTGETVDDFSIGEALLKKRNKDWRVLNHGELCPQQCE